MKYSGTVVTSRFERPWLAPVEICLGITSSWHTSLRHSFEGRFSNIFWSSTRSTSRPHPPAHSHSLAGDNLWRFIASWPSFEGLPIFWLIKDSLIYADGEIVPGVSEWPQDLHVCHMQCTSCVLWRSHFQGDPPGRDFSISSFLLIIVVCLKSGQPPRIFAVFNLGKVFWFLVFSRTDGPRVSFQTSVSCMQCPRISYYAILNIVREAFMQGVSCENGIQRTQISAYPVLDVCGNAWFSLVVFLRQLPSPISMGSNFLVSTQSLVQCKKRCCWLGDTELPTLIVQHARLIWVGVM